MNGNPHTAASVMVGDAQSGATASRCIRLDVEADAAASLVLPVLDRPLPSAPAGHCVVEVRSAGVNPSDAKAALGFMPHARWPRIPGRDYAGVVLYGPADWIGKSVWGCGGDLGIRRDGTHATHLIVPTASVREIPPGVDMREAGAVGVPFVTAFAGLRRAGLPGCGQSVLVLGANGAVGQAAMQIAAHLGARTIGVVRSELARRACRAETAPVLVAGTDDLAGEIRSLTGGRGADVVFNTVGSAYFDLANRCMALQAHQVFIATTDRAVPFDIFAFYRGQHSYHGIDSLALDCTACADILEQMALGFARGALRAFPVTDECCHGLDDALDAYRGVLAGTRQRLVIEPWRAVARPELAGNDD